MKTQTQLIASALYKILGAPYKMKPSKYQEIVKELPEPDKRTEKKRGIDNLFVFKYADESKYREALDLTKFYRGYGLYKDPKSKFDAIYVAMDNRTTLCFDHQTQTVEIELSQ